MPGEPDAMAFIYSKVLVFLLVLAYSLAGFYHRCDAASNLALGKPYSVTPKPNYPLTAAPSDLTSLTDGKYTVGYFVKSKTTVGWQGGEKVEVLIDLQKVGNIGEITFSTARAENADVFYPKHINAFIGSDNEHFSYAGDLAQSKDNVPGSYQTKRFALKGVGAKGRYVLLEIAPRGYYLFCDEIEVIEGAPKGGQGTGTLGIGGAREHAKTLQRADQERATLTRLIEKLRGEVSGSRQWNSGLSELARRVSSPGFPGRFKELETELLRLRGDSLRLAFPGRRLMVEAVSPWASLNPVQLPGRAPSRGVSLLMPVGGYGQGAFVVTNVTEIPLRLSLAAEGKSSEVASLSLHHVPFVESHGAAEVVADPLAPVGRGFVLRSGESRMVMVTAFGKKPGKRSGSLRVAGPGAELSIPLTVEVSPVRLPVNFRLNTVNWGYLDSERIANRKKEVVQDLTAHHVNVVVVPPTQIPHADNFKPSDFSRLEAYLELHGSAGKVLLYMAFNFDEKRLTCSGRCSFMDPLWKEEFLKWYAAVIKTAAKAGIPQSRLYLYPYDEMSGRYVAQFVALANWARREIPGVRFYATLNTRESLQSVPYLDVAQISNKDELLGQVRPGRTQLWLYDGSAPARSLSPYSFYRLLPWKAFRLGYQGAGFWDYSSFAGWEGEGGADLDDFPEKGDSYAVVYQGRGRSIVSSRRWEAWRAGVEDYELLTMYAAAKGSEAARALARTVLEHPQEISKADEVRQQILRALSN